MNSVIKFFSKTSFGFALLLLFVTFLFAFGQAYAGNFTFENVHITNDGKVINNVQTNSNTGGNTTNNNNGGSVTVQTGNAGSQTTICNDVNHTVINGNSSAGCPSSVSPTPTAAPVPTATPTPGGSGCTSNCGGGSTGPGPTNSGSSPSSSSSGGSSAPTQAVLGTMAGTGTFEQNLMNMFALLGFGLVTFSSYKLKKSY